MCTPSRLTRWLAVLVWLCASAPDASSQSPNPVLASALDTLQIVPLAPSDAGRAGLTEVYAVPRLLLEDYIVCTVEARTLRLRESDTDAAIDGLRRQLDVREAQATALEDALEACDLARRLTTGRLDAAQTDAEQLRLELADAEQATRRAERSRDRWRLLASLGPATAAGVGFVVGLLISR